MMPMERPHTRPRKKHNMDAQEMQRRSAKARWSGKTSKEKREAMSALAKARWAKRKPKRVARRSNVDLNHGEDDK